MIKPLKIILNDNKQVNYAILGPYPLTITHSKLINYFKGKDFIRWPNKMFANPNSRDKSKFYEYHDHSHNTEDYKPLKWEMVQLFKAEHLKEFSYKGKTPMRDKQKEQIAPPKQLRIVGSIIGGSEISGISVSASVAHIRRVHLVIPMIEASDK